MSGPLTQPRGAAAAPPVEGGSPELHFSIADARVLQHAAAPTLEFALRIDAGGVDVRSLMLHAQLRIMAERRDYAEPLAAGLEELFGQPGDWGRNLRGLFWVEASRVVPPFNGATEVPLRVACGYDFDVAASKYLHAVHDGTVPLEFLFSGSVFYAGPAGALQVVRLPWDREAQYLMPAGLWTQLMDLYYPKQAWLRVRRDVFDRLNTLRAAESPPTWDAAIERLLDRNDG